MVKFENRLSDRVLGIVADDLSKRMKRYEEITLSF